MKKKHILFLAGQYPPQFGGLARAAQRYVTYLAEDHEVTVVCPSYNTYPGKVQTEKIRGITIHRIGDTWSFTHAPSFVQRHVEQLHAEHCFELFVGFYLTYAGYIAATCGFVHARPSIVCARGNDIDLALSIPAQVPFVQQALTSATSILCVTRDLQQQAKEVTSRDDIFYVPNGVDVEFWKPLPKDPELVKQYTLEGKYVLGFVGELREKKSPRVIFETLIRMYSRMPTVLMLVGSIRGEAQILLDEYRRLHPYIHSAIITVDYVHVPEEIRRYYSVMDVVLLPSQKEGMSNMLLEAMSMGKVVCVSDVGGNKDVVEHYKNGFVIPHTALDTFPEEVTRIAEMSRSAIEGIQRLARIRVETDFTAQQERSKVKTIFSEVLKS